MIVLQKLQKNHRKKLGSVSIAVYNGLHDMGSYAVGKAKINRVMNECQFN
jgi:hypothetical protein